MKPYLSIEEIKLLILSIDNTRDRLILEILYETGCSLNELVNIRIKDINKTIKIKNRRIKTSENLSKLIKKYSKNRKPNDFLFSSRENHKISKRRIQQILNKHSGRILKKNITPNTLRATHIIHDFLDRKPIKQIETEVGIKNIQPYIYAFFRTR
ncbi:tyrosine-type recombinase/integrase [Candidatus Woesearchaeota archaeon]|nr:tyrosine-type recombinase/integrase [Candidatus Woesearchaeota archaeon]